MLRRISSSINKYLNHPAFRTLTTTPHTPFMSRKYLPLPEFDPLFSVPSKNDKGFRPIVWIDCEMTGLDTFKDHIIEICCIITDGHLNLLHPGYESTIHYDADVMCAMNEWCVKHHGDSGLTAKVLASQKSLSQVEDELLEYVSNYTCPNSAVLAGNSVHMDRAFMMREFPRVLDHLHYRIIDVSSFSEMGQRHNPKLLSKCPRKREAHTAKADILESIAQLKWLREIYFVGPSATDI